MNEPGTLTNCSLQPRRSPWRKRLLLGSLVATPLCLAIWFTYFVSSSDWKLQQALAEADQLDPGWHIPELEEKRAVIPEKENSGFVLIAAERRMPPKWPRWDYPQASQNRKRSEEESRTLREDFSDLRPCMQLDEQQIAALREELQRAGMALAAVRSVVDLPRGRYPINYTKDFFCTLLPHTEVARTMGNLLAYDAVLRAQDADVDGALASCHGILNCGRSIGDEPSLVSMLVRVASTAVATKNVERTLAQGAPSEPALLSIQHAFEQEAEQPLLLIAARGERGMIDGLMNAIQVGDVRPKAFFAVYRNLSIPEIPTINASSFPPKLSLRNPGFLNLLRVPGMIPNLRAALLRYNNRFVAVAQLPVEQQIGRVKELEAAGYDVSELARPILAADMSMSAAFHRSQAELRCAVVMVALERYRRANNRWPNTLTDLLPTYLPKVPLDPFDGAPLRYRRLDTGVVIYSIGPDRKDSGSTFDKDVTNEGIDLGFRLWDLSQRRTLPHVK